MRFIPARCNHTFFLIKSLIKIKSQTQKRRILVHLFKISMQSIDKSTSRSGQKKLKCPCSSTLNNALTGSFLNQGNSSKLWKYFIRREILYESLKVMINFNFDKKHLFTPLQYSKQYFSLHKSSIRLLIGLHLR